MQSTIELFRHLYEHLPPLFPEESKEKMQHALEHIEGDPAVTLPEIEDTMISFGYVAWPWNQAYSEFLHAAEGVVGNHFLDAHLSASLREKYQSFRHFGGTLRDLHSGRPADFFTGEERGELCAALVDMQQDLKKYVEQEVKGVGQNKYLARVGEFQRLLGNIRLQLENLRALADQEQDHPTLAAELRARVRGFEEGLCLLGPELDYDAVCQTHEFFHERKQHLTRMKGIHEPVTVDWYGATP